MEDKKEIERKFLVDRDLWEKSAKGKPKKILQAYLSKQNPVTRVRIKEGQAYLTIKGETKGITRSEYEYPIPVEDAKQLINEFCTAYIEKERYSIEHQGKVWEVDDFSHPNKGLLLAEIELEDENESFSSPNWLKEEVSHLKKYYNSNMI